MCVVALSGHCSFRLDSAPAGGRALRCPFVYCSPPASASGRASREAHAPCHASHSRLNTAGAWHGACALGAALGPMPTQEAQSMRDRKEDNLMDHD